MTLAPAPPVPHDDEASAPAEHRPDDLDAPRLHLHHLDRRGRRLMVGLGLLVVAAFFMSLACGPLTIPLGDVVAHLFALVGIDVGAPDPTTAPFVALRLARGVLGLGVGAALGLAGATMQGLFRNPLADPGLIGVSSGARLGATAFIVLGGGSVIAASPAAALLLLPACAFGGALATMMLVRRLATRSGATHVTVLLLAGLALTAFEEATVGLLGALSNDQALRSATLWRLGTLGGADMPVAALVSAATVLGGLYLLRLGRPLDALLLGEAEAHSLGIAVERLKRRSVLVSALIVATATAFVGIVGFVGLVVPHLVRLVAGPSHRVVLPASALLGALLVVLADLLARTVASPTELPLGVITAFVGAPFLLWLVLTRGGAA